MILWELSVRGAQRDECRSRKMTERTYQWIMAERDTFVGICFGLKAD